MTGHRSGPTGRGHHWTDEDIEAAKAMLRDEETTVMAARRLSHKLKRRVTKGALETAFYARGLRPVDYLRGAKAFVLHQRSFLGHSCCSCAARSGDRQRGMRARAPVAARRPSGTL